MAKSKYEHDSPRERKRDSENKSRKFRQQARPQSRDGDINLNTLTHGQALHIVTEWHEWELNAIVKGKDFARSIENQSQDVQEFFLNSHQKLCKILSPGETDVENLIDEQPEYLQPYLKTQRDYLLRAVRLALEGVSTTEYDFSVLLDEMPQDFRSLAMRYHQEAKKVQSMRGPALNRYCQSKSDIDQVMLKKMQVYFKNPAKISVSGTIKVQIGFDEIEYNKDEGIQKHEKLLEAVIDRSDNDKLICPITHSPFKQPVFAMDGHTYEYDAIKQYMEEHLKFDLDTAKLSLPKSPLTQQPMQPFLMHADTVQQEINALISLENGAFQEKNEPSKNTKS